MKTISIRSILAAVAALPASAALAHDGHHEGMSATQGLRHLLTDPDHVAMLAILIVLVGLGGWRFYRSRSPR